MTFDLRADLEGILKGLCVVQCSCKLQTLMYLHLLDTFPHQGKVQSPPLTEVFTETLSLLCHPATVLGVLAFHCPDLPLRQG